MFGDTRCQRRDLRADAVLQAVLAEVGAPRPAHDHRSRPGCPARRRPARRSRRTRSGARSTRADRSPRRARSSQSSAHRPSTGWSCAGGAPSCGGAACARRAGRPQGPSGCRSSECPRRRPSRSAGRARRREPWRPPSRRAHRSSRFSRSPAPCAPFLGPGAADSTRGSRGRPRAPRRAGAAPPAQSTPCGPATRPRSRPRHARRTSGP